MKKEKKILKKENIKKKKTDMKKVGKLMCETLTDPKEPVYLQVALNQIIFWRKRVR